MAAPKGIAAIEWLARRTKEQRGGNAPQPDHFDRTTPDALALWRDAYLDMLKTRNYAEGTIEGRVFDLKFFLLWAEERDLKQASQITRPSWNPSSVPSGVTPSRMATVSPGRPSVRAWARSRTTSAGSPAKTSSCTWPLFRARQVLQQRGDWHDEKAARKSQ